jgi:hypothetical protein
MLFIGVTGGPGRHHAHELLERTMLRLRIPLVAA